MGHQQEHIFVIKDEIILLSLPTGNVVIATARYRVGVLVLSSKVYSYFHIVYEY
jgi:hypothetical protein